MNRLSVSPTFNQSTHINFGNSVIGSNRETILNPGDLTCNEVSPNKKKCCKLCSISIPETCWRKQLIEYLDTKSQFVLCLESESDSTKDAYNMLTGNETTKTWRH